MAGWVAERCGRAEPVALAAEKKGMAGLRLESLGLPTVLLNGRLAGLGSLGFFKLVKGILSSLRHITLLSLELRVLVLKSSKMLLTDGESCLSVTPRLADSERGT